MIWCSHRWNDYEETSWPGQTIRQGEKNTPIQLAVLWDKIQVLRVLLKHDRSLGYLGEAKSAEHLLFKAAYRGHVGVARELLRHCPDAPYRQTNQLHRLINMRDEDDETPLHLAVKRCNPKMVAAFLLHPDIDVTVLNDSGVPPIQRLNWVRLLDFSAHPYLNSPIVYIVIYNPRCTFGISQLSITYCIS